MSSSEDEEELKALREATDSNFLNDSLFQTTNSSEKKETKEPVLKSLRRDKERDEHFENLGLTQDFKDFVSKKLTETLNRIIDDDEILEQPKYTPKKQSGIRLFSSSKKLSKLEEKIDETEKINKENKKKRKSHPEDESHKKKMIQEAAVDIDRLLSKEDTKMWQNKRKGKEFRYKKMKDGTLVEQV